MKRKIPGIIQVLLLIIIVCVCFVLIVVSIRNKKEINFKDKKIEFLESELEYSRHQAFEMNTMFEGFYFGSFAKYITSGGEVVEIGDIVDKFPVICLYFSDNSCSSCIDELIDYINESDFLSYFKFIVFTPLSSSRLSEQLASQIKKEVNFLSSDRMDELFGIISENPIVFTLNSELEMHHVFKFMTSDKKNIDEYFSGLLDRYHHPE
ncbi:MAG: hypothetical protein U5K32_11230 [Bacteroidales bacterium]|nr:hypothetical protein [Bacteroidales bacterium]